MLRSVLPSVRAFVCLSHAPSSITVHFGLWLLENINRNPHDGSWTHWPEWLTTGSDPNGNEAVISEVFARWLHHRQGGVELLLAAYDTWTYYRFAAQYLLLPTPMRGYGMWLCASVRVSVRALKRKTTRAIDTTLGTRQDLGMHGPWGQKVKGR